MGVWLGLNKGSGYPVVVLGWLLDWVLVVGPGLDQAHWALRFIFNLDQVNIVWTRNDLSDKSQGLKV